MTLGRAILALAVVVLLAAVALLPRVDASYGYGAPAPEEYFHEFGPSGRYGDVACKRTDGVEAARRGKDGTITAATGAGADTAVIGPGTSIRIYDYESGRTGTDHDLLVVVRINPDLITMFRYGPHLVMCGDRAPLELILLRQYCRGQTGENAWNNEFEEIVFPSAREIWFTDDLYAVWKADGDLKAVSRFDEEKEGAKLLTGDTAAWRVRSFSDALPDQWFAPWACRRDLR
jgi:hypothetical protein